MFRISPPVGKSGPLTCFRRSLTASFGSSISAISAATISRRLCGGMLVAMPTAMPGRAVHQELRDRARQHDRLVERGVVVGAEGDGVVPEVVEHLLGERRQPRLGVAHGRRAIAVERAEVALAVDQRVAQRELLRHADHRLVRRDVAVRVILAEHVADDRRRLPRPRARRQAQVLEHRSRGCGAGPASGRRARRAARAR